jgi:hypothetical protein
MQKRSSIQTIFTLILIAFFTVVFGRAGDLSAMQGSSDNEKFEQQVASLALGFGEYNIANKLSPEQKEKAQKSLLEKSYPGTYTFADEEVFVLVVEENDMILAVYRKNEDAGREQTKEMVANLMTRFGSPTSEAHDQIIYWAYGEKGKISDEVYAKLKQDEESGIVATVKFKSDLTFTENDMATDKKNSIYCIVSSPRMLEKFYQQ